MIWTRKTLTETSDWFNQKPLGFAAFPEKWGIPCVVGTNKATEILKDGDLVEICGEEGMVKIMI